MIRNNNQKYNQLRQDYNVFTFERFDYVLNTNEIIIKYTFNLSDKHHFEPELVIHLIHEDAINLPITFLETLIFNLGMIELISYWKAACPPVIIVKPRTLDRDQILFWKKVYFHGLGEFFYLNGIDANPEGFVDIESRGSRFCEVHTLHTRDSRVIVPVGGGKDSVVTLELLKDKFEVVPFIINPRTASRETVRVAGFSQKDILRVDRRIDPRLIELNERGYLNGHTPFSALVAFASLIAAAISRTRYIALSNEASANEPTVAGGPNHQYSKSLDFEHDFREYVFRYITPDIEYFSFLRPMHEIGIAQLFSHYPRYFEVFKSCNVGSKLDKWCGKCPKCLFTAVILAPFIEREDLIHIFGYDILDNRDLLPLLNALSGMAQNKPFECVGTIDEVNLALALSIDRYKTALPFLLSHYKSTPSYDHFSSKTQGSHIEINDAHFLPSRFFEILKMHVHAGSD